MPERIGGVEEIVVTKPSKEFYIVPKGTREWWNGIIVRDAELLVDPGAFSLIYTSDADFHLIAEEPEKCACEMEEKDGAPYKRVVCGWTGKIIKAVPEKKI